MAARSSALRFRRSNAAPSKPSIPARNPDAGEGRLVTHRETEHLGFARSCHGLEVSGIRYPRRVLWNLSSAALTQEAIFRDEAALAHGGPIVVRTGQCTGRSPSDKYVVGGPATNPEVWWGQHNQPFPRARYERLRWRLTAYLQGRDLFVQDCHVGTDPRYRIPLRVITTAAWQNLFARNMFVRTRNRSVLEQHLPEYTLIVAPQFRAAPDQDRTRSEVFVIVNFERKEILIGGTAYAGEIKKSVFSVMNWLMPAQDVLPMHCSANYGADENDLAIFFGLSGTGKTTLSAVPGRTLIGDDEHGWGPDGVFNFEGGCYAKVIRLSRQGEPEIHATTRKFGTILENVVMRENTRRLDLDSAEFTENTRASYPVTHIPSASQSGVGGHPRVVLMLTADAFGVLPPIARLDPEQAMRHFLAGYTAKVAGTERGIREPQATFSACFGAPFMTRRPEVYARLLQRRIEERDVRCYLVNTGWSGGPYGISERMPLALTRQLVRTALDGEIERAGFTAEPVFGLGIPRACPGVASELLDPRRTWDDGRAYDRHAGKLRELFEENMRRQRFKTRMHSIGVPTAGTG